MGRRDSSARITSDLTCHGAALACGHQFMRYRSNRPSPARTRRNKSQSLALPSLEDMEAADATVVRVAAAMRAALAAHDEKPTGRRWRACLTRGERLHAVGLTRGELIDRALEMVGQQLTEVRSSMGWRIPTVATGRDATFSKKTNDAMVKKAVASMCATDAAYTRNPTNRRFCASLTQIERLRVALVTRRRLGALELAEFGKVIETLKGRAKAGGRASKSAHRKRVR
jgi:hypothetical protein